MNFDSIMMKVGITGNIGSGKTTVCKIFEILGVPVFNADEESKKILFNDPVALSEVKKAFGEEIFSDGIPDRKRIAELVFNDEGKLEQLNSILHPVVIQKAEDWFNSQNGHPYALKEAALIFEVSGEKLLDKVIVVSAPEPLRIKRIVLRDGVSETEVRARMARQISQDEKIRRADYVINNDETETLIPQVIKIHNELSHMV